ncbi:uncharacterized protein LOC116425736 [Nomia melanderi]|uniref:uncharacterized protein LOC116425736 n=1 Tax=Nomia melanderi TaxID=2448451 RepID=UPI003FCDD7A4
MIRTQSYRSFKGTLSYVEATTPSPIGLRGSLSVTVETDFLSLEDQRSGNSLSQKPMQACPLSKDFIYFSGQINELKILKTNALGDINLLKFCFLDLNIGF